MSVRGRRVAVLGGAGFIGHHLALALAERGAEVSVVDALHVNNLLALLDTTDEELPQRPLYLRMVEQRLALLRAAGVRLHVQDARDHEALTRLLHELEPQVVVQAAAVAHANRSNREPRVTFEHSMTTLANALEAVRGRAEHFVYLSSSMVYGNFRAAEVDEEHPLEPIGVYGALKVAGEKLVTSYQQVFDLPFTIVRPSALYGPRCVSRRVGQVFVEAALEGRPLHIDGDGGERLDFTYVDDLVQGLVLALERPEARGETFNVTYGSARSVADMAEAVRSAFPGVRVEHGERDRLMPLRGTLSVDRARALLGYAPAHPIELGVPKYVDWYRRLLGRPPVAAVA